MKTKNSAIRLVILLIATVMSFASCKEDAKIVIKGEMSDGKDVTLHLVMHYPDRVVDEVIATRQGSFEFTVPAVESGNIMVEVFSHNYRLLGVVMVDNSSKTSMKIDPQNLARFSADGNEFNRAYSNFLFDNRENIEKRNTDAVNKAVAEYVRNNSESAVSTVLMMTIYDSLRNPDEAARLYKSISENARPDYFSVGYGSLVTGTAGTKTDTINAITLLSSKDSLVRLDPTEYRATFIAFSTDDPQRGDSIKTTLREVSRRAGRRGLVVDHLLSSDTLSWKRQLRRDTATWTSVWSGMGVSSPGADRFAIPSLPYFVVTDSAGRMTYRGTSATAAAEAFKKQLAF